MTRNSNMLNETELNLICGGLPCPTQTCREGGGDTSGNVELNPPSVGVDDPQSIY